MSADAAAPRAATPTSARVVVATSDPLFAALCTRALAGTPLALAAAVSPPELLEAARQLAPELIVLDADGEEAAALMTLAGKVMLVSDAHVVVVSAYLAPGSPGLCALLQSIAATFVQKPAGPSSLGLAVADGPPFAAALQAAFAAHDGVDLDGPPHPQLGNHPPADLDAGWEVDEPPPTAAKRTSHD